MARSWKPATYAQYCTDVVSELQPRWQQRCFCESAQFCKLLSYDFRDYGHDTSCLLDAEILIDAIIYKLFTPVDEGVEIQSRQVRGFQCPQCAAHFRVEQEQYGVAMWCSFARRVDRPMPKMVGQYLWGFKGFVGFDASKISDFSRASSLTTFLDGIIGPT